MKSNEQFLIFLGVFVAVDVFVKPYLSGFFGAMFPKPQPVVSFHMNETIKVKLKPSGYEFLANQFNTSFPNPEDFGYRTPEYYSSRADADGYTSFVAWDFIKKFGNAISIAGPEFFHLDIVIVNPQYSC